MPWHKDIGIRVILCRSDRVSARGSLLWQLFAAGRTRHGGIGMARAVAVQSLVGGDTASERVILKRHVRATEQSQADGSLCERTVRWSSNSLMFMSLRSFWSPETILCKGEVLSCASDAHLSAVKTNLGCFRVQASVRLKPLQRYRGQ